MTDGPNDYARNSGDYSAHEPRLSRQQRRAQERAARKREQRSVVPPRSVNGCVCLACRLGHPDDELQIYELAEFPGYEFQVRESESGLTIAAMQTDLVCGIGQAWSADGDSEQYFLEGRYRSDGTTAITWNPLENGGRQLAEHRGVDVAVNDVVLQCFYLSLVIGDDAAVDVVLSGNQIEKLDAWISPAELPCVGDVAGRFTVAFDDSIIPDGLRCLGVAAPAVFDHLTGSIYAAHGWDTMFERAALLVLLREVDERPELLDAVICGLTGGSNLRLECRTLRMLIAAWLFGTVEIERQ